MSSVPGVARYDRMPTRHKIHLAWVFVFCMGAGLQLCNLTIGRVNPKREEAMYERLQERFGGDIPEKYLKETIALRELRETLSLQTAIEVPTPGESTAAMQKVMDYRLLKSLKE